MRLGKILLAFALVVLSLFWIEIACGLMNQGLHLR